MLLIQIQKIEAGKPFEKLGELHIRNVRMMEYGGKNEYEARYYTKDSHESIVNIEHDREDGFLALTRDILDELLKQPT